MGKTIVLEEYSKSRAKKIGLIKKYGDNLNYANTIMGLSYFEDAEQELLPKTFLEYNWEEIKKSKAQKLGIPVEQLSKEWERKGDYATHLRYSSSRCNGIWLAEKEL